MDGMREDVEVMTALEHLMARIDEPLDGFMNALHNGGHLDGSPMSLLLFTLARGVHAWNNNTDEGEPFDRMVQAVMSSPQLSQLMMMSGRGMAE